MEALPQPLSFDWDWGNINKNLQKHGVRDEEAEEVFLDSEKKILKDVLHSGREERFVVLGKTKKTRLLFVVFTLRGKKVRIISARDLSRKEKLLYCDDEKET